MTYVVCTGPGCEVELRQSDAYACDICWREGMGKSPRVEWKKFSDKVDVTPSRNCDYCHRRIFKWLAQATVCNSCFFKENSTFKEDTNKTLKFLREYHPSPWSKDFKGDVTLVAMGRDSSPIRGDQETSHHGAGHIPAHPDSNHQAQPSVHDDHPRDRPWAEGSKPGPIQVQAHRFVLASKSSVFRKMFDKEAKEKCEADREKMHHDGNHQENSPERRHHGNHGDDRQEPHRHAKHDDDSEQQHDAETEEKRQSGVFRIDGIEASVLRAGVNFMYTAEIDFTEKIKPLEMLRFAHEYHVPWLKMVCEKELVYRITVKNLPEMLRLSYRWEGEYLKKAARKFFEEHPEVHNDVLDSLLTAG